MRDPRSGLNLPFAMVFAALIAIGLIGGSVYLALQLLPPRQQGPEPISLLPRQPEGITIMLRAPPEPEPDDQSAPGSPGNSAGPGFAAELGGAGSFTDLSQRFERLARDNAELPFEQLEPRAIIADTANGLEARLLVGPFESIETAETFCANVALPADIGCRPAAFGGERIARQ